MNERMHEPWPEDSSGFAICGFKRSENASLALIPTWLCAGISPDLCCYFPSLPVLLLLLLPARCAGPVSAAVPFSKLEAFAGWRQVEEEAPSCQYFLPSWQRVSSSWDAWSAPGLGVGGQIQPFSAFFFFKFWIIKESLQTALKRDHLCDPSWL